MTKPKLDFTIEDLLKEAIIERKEVEANLFTARDFATLWGLKLRAVYKHMDKLIEMGWQFVPTKKPIRDRSGRETTTSAYRVIPPKQNKPPE